MLCLHEIFTFEGIQPFHLTFWRLLFEPRKILSLGHPELRWVSRPPGTPTPTPVASPGHVSFAPECAAPAGGFFGTVLPSNWTAEELELYDKLFDDLKSKELPTTDAMDPMAILQSEYLAQCGLSRRALREIWQVANPQLKTSLGLEEFRASCRLVGHCQAMSLQEDEKARLETEEKHPANHAVVSNSYVLC